ncbi:hypothetical protein QTP86_020443 [Hemibagrus guttatus]|nr:hypothetical protein QTP86_020443 [Hemibagrus guttatus]
MLAGEVKTQMAERIPWWKAFTGRVLSNILKDAAVQQDQGSDSKNSGFLSDGFDVSQLEPALIENTFSRNLTVSRSGRFKEKRKVRATLPTNKNIYESNTAVAK